MLSSITKRVVACSMRSCTYLQPTDGGGLAFVPMIWGVHPDRHHKEDNRWIDDELRRLDAHATTLLGFNEPDGKNEGQSDIDVATVCICTTPMLGHPTSQHIPTVWTSCDCLLEPIPCTARSVCDVAK